MIIKWDFQVDNTLSIIRQYQRAVTENMCTLKLDIFLNFKLSLVIAQYTVTRLNSPNRQECKQDQQPQEEMFGLGRKTFAV